jgi:hypothetical protein
LTASRQAAQKSPVGLTRTPPKVVRDALCREIGFRCPVEGCGSPYLTFHHFDPPWRTRQHHESAGMIALCTEHAGKADSNHYPDDYLRELKAGGEGRYLAVQGKFDYLRRDAIWRVGGNVYIDTPVIIELNNEPLVYWSRDERGFVQLSFKLIGPNGAPKVHLEDNVWLIPPGAALV